MKVYIYIAVQHEGMYRNHEPVYRTEYSDWNLPETGKKQRGEDDHPSYQLEDFHACRADHVMILRKQEAVWWGFLEHTKTQKANHFISYLKFKYDHFLKTKGHS